MNVGAFLTSFREAFPGDAVGEPSVLDDMLPGVDGMVSPKGQLLLNLACSAMPRSEVYLEVGCWQGKMLLSAAWGNQGTYVGCDNFVHFSKDRAETRAKLLGNAREHLPLTAEFAFYQQDFREMFQEWGRGPIGVYVYDAAHDRVSQRDGIVLAEPHLADEALVVVDDWRMRGAMMGTHEAIERSQNQWEVLLDLPARHNGDTELWWNGMRVMRFRRTA